MRPSNMGIQSAASAPMPQPGTPIGGEHSLESPLFPPSQLRRLNEEGASVPGSQDMELATQASRALNLDDEARDHSRSQRWTVGTPTATDSSQRLPLADAASSPFIREGRFCCPWCDWETQYANGLMIHASRMHAGTILGDHEARGFRALGQKTCQLCGHLRCNRSKHCSRCAHTPARSVQAGDMICPTQARVEGFLQHDTADGIASRIPAAPAETTRVAHESPSRQAPTNGHSAGVSRQVQPGTDAQGASTQPSGTRARRNRRRWVRVNGVYSFRQDPREPVTRQRRGATPVLPLNFLQRCEALKGAATVHIPKSKREEIAAAFGDCLEGTLDGEDTWGTLQQALFKVLLYGIPSGVTAECELTARLLLWREDRWDELLLRVEAQAGQRSTNIERENTRKKRTATAARAKRLAREGARSKAVAGLKGGIKKLTPAEQQQWGAKLFPRAGPGRRPYSRDETMTGGASAETRANGAARDNSDAVPDATSGSTHASSDDEWTNHPLKGISFKPMSGTGPSNCRPEHIQDLLSVRKRALKRRLFKLLERIIEGALDGALPPAARWILNTGVTFLEKPAVDTPRPIRAGEWVRKVVAKVLLRRHRAKIRTLMLRFGQFGVAIPGGVEMLYHARNTIETVAESGVLGPMAVVDLDLVNFYGSVEWNSILQAYDEFFQEGYKWEKWCTSECCAAFLPSGDKVVIDRGAGQGEPDGPLKASLTLGRAVQQARGDLGPDCKFADGWYIDDGLLCCRPWLLDRILRAIDLRLFEMGATRGSASNGDNIKSAVRVFAKPEDSDAIRGWDTAYVRDTCRIRAGDDASKYLGGTLGSRDQIGANFDRVVATTGELHDAIGGIDDPATQMVLRSSCADVNKVVYLLRLNGDKLAASELEELTRIQRSGVAHTLSGDVGDLAWKQANGGQKKAGLGLRSALELAMPAFVASRTASQAGVMHLLQRLEDAGIATTGQLMQVYDQRTHEAVQTLEREYRDHPAAVQKFQQILEQGANSSAHWWNAALAGDADTESPIDQGGRAGAELLSSEGLDGHDEDGDAALRDLKHAVGIQKHLTRTIDDLNLEALRQRYDQEGSEEDVRRLRDLTDEKNQDFSWWDRLNPELDRVLNADDWTRAMRTMLGAQHLVADSVCGNCGQQRLDAQCYHALCCAGSEKTIGHNRLRDCAAEAFHMADPGTALEVPGLCPAAPTLRPADVLTRGAHPTLIVAVDIGVRAPHASTAGDDAAESMLQEKLDYYGDHLDDLAQQGIVYKPMIFTAYGRRHPSATNMLNHAATTVARQRGYANAKGLRRHWERQLAAEIWRRAARMVKACLPTWRPSRDEEEDEDVGVDVDAAENTDAPAPAVPPPAPQRRG